MYNFKTAVEAWSVLYDELGHTDVDHSIDNFYNSCARGRVTNESVGIGFRILEPQNCLMWSPIRKLSPIYLAKECMWYLNGSRDVKDAPANIWNDLVNKDGDEKGLVNSNYGHYIFVQKDNKNPELTVFDATVELLKRDPYSRQAIWQIPIMKHRQDDDTPCTSSIQFLLRDNKLNCIVYMRSCDIWFGLPNDMTQFIIWQMMMAKELNVEMGTYTHLFGSLHCYKENFITDNEKYITTMNEIYKKGKEDIYYFEYYDDRNYRDILSEIMHDFDILSNKSKNEILDNKLLKNEELIYMLNNMNVSKFIH